MKHKYLASVSRVVVKVSRLKLMLEYQIYQKGHHGKEMSLIPLQGANQHLLLIKVGQLYIELVEIMVAFGV